MEHIVTKPQTLDHTDTARRDIITCYMTLLQRAAHVASILYCRPTSGFPSCMTESFCHIVVPPTSI